MSSAFLVTAFSFIIVILFCSQNNLVFGQSVNVVKTYDDWGKYFFIQDDSKSTQDDSKSTQDDSKSTQDDSKNNLNEPPSVLDKKFESSNQGSGSALDEEQTNDNTTQSTSSALDEEQDNIK